ncbi:uncharacterized protein CC84DRAFT_1086226 [Paraphaeosphaeria sporulosa]|uniref:Uncharacterized protein n=1 Tax=Paraphaeosphaeria sporulosa TaxID=1460663 RepID=A0A177CLQ5_9PLEO|nr:uncharacterized protein CC84DRAFT_1086226 [Paraphaeosphaeria sporulosa]OAG08465.1 hypothetical protein CC84DRAFT_1086226 [Paraphaeosphaeria sporulosa]
MASEQSFACDLRSEAKESIRDKTSRVKWAHGASYGPGRRAEENRPRPARVAAVPKALKSSAGIDKNRTAIRNDIAYASGDSSADEDVEHPSVAPVPDAGVAYSFDAERGPSHGSQILGLALAKAIESYEVRQTDKLIKEEYEVLRLDDDALSPGPKAARKGVAPEDEDYEFIEA